MKPLTNEEIKETLKEVREKYFHYENEYGKMYQTIYFFTVDEDKIPFISSTYQEYEKNPLEKMTEGVETFAIGNKKECLKAYTEYIDSLPLRERVEVYHEALLNKIEACYSFPNFNELVADYMEKNKSNNKEEALETLESVLKLLI